MSVENSIYPAENLFIIRRKNGPIKDLIFLREEERKLIIRSFGDSPYSDYVLNSEDQEMIADLRENRIKINDFLRSSFLKETSDTKSKYTREYYDLQTVALMYNAFACKYNSTQLPIRNLLDRLSKQACFEWKRIITFVDDYDEEFLNNNPQFTTITNRNNKFCGQPITEENKERFLLFLLFEIRLLLYSYGSNYWRFEEYTANPDCLRKAALLAGIKGYVYNNISMKLKDGELFFNVGTIKTVPRELEEKITLMYPEKNR